MTRPRTIPARIYCPSAKGVDKRQLAAGIKVEMEHTADRRAARCIALAHLHESSRYYTALAAMERRLKRRGR